MITLSQSRINRQFAIENGQKTFEGRPCKYGHSIRYVNKNGCVKCINHRATIGQKLNPEKVSEASRHWRTKNPEKHKKSYSNWVNSEQGRLLKNASNAKRRAVRLHALPSWLTTEQLQEIKEIYKNCPLGYEVDHIIPLQGKNICGLHVPSNLQYLLKFDNRSKHNNWNPE